MRVSAATIDYKYLRPKKADVLRSWDEAPFEKVTDVEVWTGKNATILPLKRFAGDDLLFGRAGVMDEDGKYVDQSGVFRRVWNTYPAENVQYRDEQAIYCGYLVKQWGHFLVEAAARLWYAVENSEGNEKLIFVTDLDAPCSIGGNYREFLELLGVYDRVEIINKPTKFQNVIVPQAGYIWRKQYSEQFKMIFTRISQNVVVPENWHGAEKVFLSRGHLKNIWKREYGHDMLDSFFLKNGYKVIYPEEISLSEMILLLNHCKECASVSGTLPHNMLFCPDYSKITIVERNVLNNEIQSDINRMKCLDVTYVDANIPIYPVMVGYGPFILGYTEQMRQYTEDRCYHAPDVKYSQKRYLRKGFAAYMKEYNRVYHYQWYMADWMVQYSDYLVEGYRAGEKYYADYLSGRKPFLLVHYFMPHYWMAFAKRIIKRMIGRN